MILLYNLTSGRQPLYELEEWVEQKDPRLFGLSPLAPGQWNDDRFGRALDKLFLADRANLMTELVVSTVRAIGLDLSQVHNDSTTVKAFGQYPGQTPNGFSLKLGKSKDHRPDLKQLVYCLTVSADGTVPIHHKTYPGNTTDDTTHIETWTTLCHITERPDFLYIADCKVCTKEQLSFIVGHGGRVITMMPDTWGEAQSFKEELRNTIKNKQVIWRKTISEEEGTYETFSCFLGNHTASASLYPLHWIYSSEKKKRDRAARDEALEKTDQELADLTGKLNTYTLKTKEQITEQVQAVLKNRSVENLYWWKLSPILQKKKVQIGKGRPGSHTRYRTDVKTLQALSWGRDLQALGKERKADGVFPLLCTDKNVSAKDALMAYKYQPRLEKRFCQFKSIHNAAPLLFKNIERIEALMFLFFMALILQSVIEREVRLQMGKNDIDSLPIYPEHRIAYHPTTAKIFDRFKNLSAYQLIQGNEIIKEYRDELTETQKKILELLRIPEAKFWP
jgi:transposase